jgi:hypothetical protein
VPEPSAWEKDLKNNGMKIIVDLTTCEIQTGTFKKEKEEISYLDELGGIDILLDAGKMPEPDQYEQSVLIYKHKTTSGKTVKFYGPTSKNKKTLEILCVMQKETTLYVDRNDYDHYYFDLEFLER